MEAPTNSNKRIRKKRILCKVQPAKLITLFLGATEKDTTKHESIASATLVLWSNGAICLNTFRQAVFYLLYDKYRAEGAKKWDAVKKSCEDVDYTESWGLQLVKHKSQNFGFL